MDNNIKQQVVERLKQANNILVTVKTDPTIDLLSACLALSLLLDKLDKHATAVFSGEVPSAMDFLKPEETIEQTPNSLRDFIISLDKTKADKLRYKVEDKVVRIFITPYKSSLSEADLEFSQGDLNVDLVVALGVHEQNELDEAVVAHGRILHDAGTISINNTPNGNLGTLNWQDTTYSAVSEMIVDLAHDLGPNLIDEQIATALLTGIVAETARFSNDKTTPQTMRIAGELMAAGANQQLVANELQNDIAAVPHDSAKPAGGADDDTLRIDHPEETTGEQTAPAEPTPEAQPGAVTPETEQSQPETEPKAEGAPKPDSEREILPMPEPDSVGQVQAATPADSMFAGAFTEEDDKPLGRSYLIDQPAADAGKTQPSGDIETQTPNPFASQTPPLLKHDQQLVQPLSSDDSSTTDMPKTDTGSGIPAFDPAAFGATDPTANPPMPSVVNPAPVASEPAATSLTPPVSSPAIPGQTLDDIEKAVESPHVDTDQGAVAEPSEHLQDARQQVLDALRQGPQPLEKPADLGTNPFGPPLHEDDQTAQTSQPAQPVAIQVDDYGNVKPVTPEPATNAPEAMDMPLPPVAPTFTPPQPPAADVNNGNNGLPPMAPPPAGPPPMMPFPPFGQ